MQRWTVILIWVIVGSLFAGNLIIAAGLAQTWLPVLTGSTHISMLTLGAIYMFRRVGGRTVFLLEFLLGFGMTLNVVKGFFI